MLKITVILILVINVIKGQEPPPLPPGVSLPPGFPDSGAPTSDLIFGGETLTLKPSGGESDPVSDSPTLINSPNRWVYCSGQWKQVGTYYICLFYG